MVEEKQMIGFHTGRLLDFPGNDFHHSILTSSNLSFLDLVMPDAEDLQKKVVSYDSCVITQGDKQNRAS
jgi:hypothetical protein